MSRVAHLSSEMISAYLDHELVGEDVRELELHLEDCSECRDRFDGMKEVVLRLRRLEPAPLPPTLDQAVARRIAIQGSRTSLLDRWEGSLSNPTRQSSFFALFAVVLALATMLFLFANALDEARRGSVSVIFSDPPRVEEGAEVVVDGRRFGSREGVWWEVGIATESAPRVLDPGGNEAEGLRERYPGLAALEGDVILRLGDEVVRFASTAPPPPSGLPPGVDGEVRFP